MTIPTKTKPVVPPAAEANLAVGEAAAVRAENSGENRENGPNDRSVVNVRLGPNGDAVRMWPLSGRLVR